MVKLARQIKLKQCNYVVTNNKNSIYIIVNKTAKTKMLKPASQLN